MSNFGNQVQFQVYQTMQHPDPIGFPLYMKSGKRRRVMYWKMDRIIILPAGQAVEKRWKLT